MAKHKQIDGQLSFADFLQNDDDAAFEAEFARLTALFDSVKTDSFDAMQFLSPIANAVKTALEEKIPFVQALEGHCSKQSAERIAAAFDAEKEKQLFAIISGMHDEI